MRFSLIAPLLLSILLAACVTQPPLERGHLIEPQALSITAIHSDKPLVALVLGSGGERGYAHIGVIKALEENGIHVDMVVGTSVGSVIGALYAGGYDGTALEHLLLGIEPGEINDFELSKRGYIRGELLQDFINRALLNRSIEQLNKPYAAVATQLSSGNSIAFNYGNTGMAVRASSSIPGVYLPVSIGAEEYVDGDLKQPVAVEVARSMGADVVIAVDISQQPEDTPLVKDVIDILQQSIRIMRQSILGYALAAAQIVIRPDIGATPEINTDSKLRLIKNGEDATLASLPQILKLIQQITDEKRRLYGDKLHSPDMN